MNTWKYYNHALLPETAPHEVPNLEILSGQEIWKDKGNGKALFARWTSDFDCKEETNWWYCMKDTPLNLTALKANRRYKINRGKRFFECKVIEPTEYREELFEIQKEAVESYPEANRYRVEHDSFIEQIKEWQTKKVYGAFFRETNQLCGYVIVRVYDTYAYLESQKASPEFEKYQINAAMVCTFLEDFEEKLSGSYYIVDGERNVFHETNFQTYLEEYFGFRKAYCRLHLKYRKGIGPVVMLLYPFRGIIKKIRKPSVVVKVNSVLFMEELVRKQKK